MAEGKKNLYQIGGISRHELQDILERVDVNKEGAAVVASGRNRFGGPADEFVVKADDKNVLSLSSDHRVNIGRIQWYGSMQDPDGEPTDTSLYPDHIPLTSKQVEILQKEHATLYRVGGIGSRELENLVAKLKRDGVNAEIVKIAGNRFDGSRPEFTMKTTNDGILALLSDQNVQVGVC